MLGISWKDRKTNEFVQRGIKARAGQQKKPVRDSEKNKMCMVWPRFSPQQPGQNSAAGNSRGRQKERKTGQMLGRQPKRMDQIGQPNPDEISRGQTFLALAVIQCVDDASPTTPQSRD